MRTLSSLFSLVRVSWVLLREGVISALPREVLPAVVRIITRLVARKNLTQTKQSQRLSNALNRLGPSWIKFGQFLATRPDLVGSDIATGLESLQDRISPFSKEQAELTFQQSIGKKVSEVFSSFSEPVAAASIAQVHRAKLKENSETVAVKVIRPGIRQRFLKDLQTFYTAAKLQEKFLPSTRRLRPLAVTEILSRSARIEMDFRLEAAALAEMASNTINDKGFKVPKVYWELTNRDCLTMAWVDGIKLSKTESLANSGHDLPKLATTLMQSFLRHTLRDGFFHADMHPGNLFVTANGDIFAVDLGIMGRIDLKERRFLAEILLGFITGDYKRVAEVHFEAGYVPEHHNVANFAQAIRAIGEPIHGCSAETISMAKLLALLFEITEIFDMVTRPELILLQKTMVVVEGVCRKLDPKFNMWLVSEPVVSEWIKCNIGPVGKLVDTAESMKAIGKLMLELPKIADKAIKLSNKMDEMLISEVYHGNENTKSTNKTGNKTCEHRCNWVFATIMLITIIVFLSLNISYFVQI